MIATADFLAHFTQTEILGLMLEPRQCIQAIGIGEQGIEGGTLVRRQMCLHQGDQALLFLCQRLTDQLLYHAIAWEHDALLEQKLQELAKDIDRLATHPSRLLGAGR